MCCYNSWHLHRDHCCHLAVSTCLYYSALRAWPLTSHCQHAPHGTASSRNPTSRSCRGMGHTKQETCTLQVKVSWRLSSYMFLPSGSQDKNSVQSAVVNCCRRWRHWVTMVTHSQKQSTAFTASSPSSVKSTLLLYHYYNCSFYHSDHVINSDQLNIFIFVLKKKRDLLVYSVDWLSCHFVSFTRCLVLSRRHLSHDGYICMTEATYLIKQSGSIIQHVNSKQTTWTTSSHLVHQDSIKLHDESYV